MSGIGGVRVFRSGTVTSDVLHRMARSLHHRGPAGSSAWVGPDIGLAHTRVSHDSSSPGAPVPPLHSADGRWVLVLDGVVHNGASLRTHLDYPFRTSSDTEVVLAGLSLEGIAFAERLHGHYAFVAHDLHTDTTHLVRDRFGVAPLHYRHVPGGIAFGSEVKAVLATGPAPAVDLRSLDAYLAHQVVPAPDTLFEGVKKVRPAHRVAIMAGGHLEETRYWEPAERDPDGVWSVADAIEAVGDGVREAVRSSVVDGPLGTQLTDDLGSHLVAAHLQLLRGDDEVHTFSVDSADHEGADRGRARRLASLLGTHHHEVPVATADDFADLWGRLTWHRDAPLHAPADVGQFQLAQAAREHVDVLLTGAGGDELFGGRADHRLARWRTRLPGSTDRQQSTAFSSAERRRLIGPPPSERRSTPTLGVDAVDRALRDDLRHRLPNDILERSDRMSRAASIDLRPCLLDQRLVELALRLPAAVKVRGSATQWVLREAARPLLPEEFIRPSSASATTTLESWFGPGLRDTVHDRLLAEGSWIAQTLDRTAVLELVRSRENGARVDVRLWTLLALETWHDCFFGTAPAVPGPRRGAGYAALPGQHA